MVEETICNMNNLYEAYLKTIKGSKWKETTQKFALDYLRNLIKLEKELKERKYEISGEGEFTLNERGKVRAITTLSPKDRVVRHVLCDSVLMPEITKKIIYDNGASITRRGITHSRKRFEAHLHKYYIHNRTNEGWILFGDFSKFYDNILHDKAKEDFLKLFNYDEYLEWLLNVIFKNFEVDVSFMNDTEINEALNGIFSMLKYREIPKEFKTKEKFIPKSCNIGDQLSQIIGIYYPHEIDSYVKTVKGFKYYGRYMDDFYIIHNSKDELIKILCDIENLASKKGIHINKKKTRIVKISNVNKYLQIKYQMTNSGKIIKRLNPKRITAMRRRLKKLSKKLKNKETEYIYIEEMFRSWMCNFYKTMSKIQRKNMLSLYEQLFNKEIVIYKKSGKWKMLFKEVKNERTHFITDRTNLG